MEQHGHDMAPQKVSQHAESRRLVTVGSYMRNEADGARIVLLDPWCCHPSHRELMALH